MTAPAKRLVAWAETLLGWVYPNVCQMCKTLPARPEEGYVCSACFSGADGVRPIRHPYCSRCGLPFEGQMNVIFECANCRDQNLYFRSARATAEFSGVVREAIHSYKYNHAVWFESFFTRLLAAEAGPAIHSSDWDFLVPVPLHWTKRLERSFNQSERVAQSLSRITGIPVNTRLLRRRQRTHAQAHLSRKARSENVQKAFACTNHESIKNARLILIDDVLTTGATANACAKLLMNNGASVVDVWTIARDVLR